MAEDTLPVWQKLYQIISGSNQNVITEVLDEVLEMCEERIIPILLDYKVYTKQSFETWKSESATSMVIQDDEMCCFVHRMSKELDLDVSLAWSMICNFLIFGYCGKVTELKSIISSETDTILLIQHLWMFYTSDRMYFLKTIRFILEKVFDRNYIYHHQFCSLFEEVDIRDLWTNSLKSLEFLFIEIDVEKSHRVSEDILDKWVIRNNYEQVEVLLLMIQLIKFVEFRLNGDELTEALTIFLKHNFGKHPSFLKAGVILEEKHFNDIRIAETGVVLGLLHRYWLKPDVFKMLPKEIETEVELLQIQGDNGTILFAWSVFKHGLAEEYVEPARRVLETLFRKKILKSFAECVTSEMFHNCEAGRVVLETTNIIFKQLVKFIPSHRYLMEQEGGLDIICMLYRDPKLRALEHLGVFFKLGLERFPYKLDSFLRMVEAIVVSEENYKKVINVLHNCPTFCSDVVWPFSSNSTLISQPTALFPDAPKFIVPMGALAEKCISSKVAVMKFHFKCSFFEVMEQFIRCLYLGASQRRELNPNMLFCVTRCTRFLTHLVKHYRGDFKLDQIIRPLLRKMDCVPTYYCQNSFKENMELFFVYFEAKCALIKYQNIDFDDSFNPVIQKILFPPIVTYQNALPQPKLFQSGYDCVLYDFLKEEEDMSHPRLLKEFVDLIVHIVKMDNPPEDILYGGVWYLLYTVFAYQKYWDNREGKDLHKLEILNGCLQVFITVLQSHTEERQSAGKQRLYRLVHNAFINDPFIIDKFYNLIDREKFAFPTWMHEEHNWVSGKSLILQETIRLQLLLLLLMFKCRRNMIDTKCEIDSRTHKFAKVACFYFVTPYKNTLSLLAGKIVHMLAKDENLPLMSCLEVDYDQIQTFFLERLRDPMEDEEIKLNILSLISTCIMHQTGMTAAFFNIQSSKRWYNPDVKRIVGDTVGHFMLDYLKNIKKSVAYLKSPLQLGILNIMANLWMSEKQHLIQNITSSEDFWALVTDPLLKPFEQKPSVYIHLFKIVSIQYAICLRDPEGQDNFFTAMEKFLNDDGQMGLFQQYLYKMFLNEDLNEESLQERASLLKVFTELLVTSHKHNQTRIYPTSECRYSYVKLALEGILKKIVYENILSTWLKFATIVFNMYGVQFKDHMSEVAQNAIEFAKIIRNHYERMCLLDKKASLTCIYKVVEQLTPYYTSNQEQLAQLLEEIATIVDFEYNHIEYACEKFKEDVDLGRALLGPWTLILCIVNCVLTYKDCDDFGIWFSNRRYLLKLVDSTSHILAHKKAIETAKLSVFSLILYVQSSLAFDFLKANMLQFFDRIEPIINTYIRGKSNKADLVELREAWEICELLMKFNIAFLRKFQASAVECCCTFLSLNQDLIRHVLVFPENNVDFKALDLLSQTLILFVEILQNWKNEWRSLYNKAFIEMTLGVRKVVNSCIYLCLRPKHIEFYCLDKYDQLTPVEQFSIPINDLMISVIDRLLGILGLAFSCLYELNLDLLNLFDISELTEPVVLIQNDFSVPRFELPIPSELTYGKLLCLAHFLCKALNQLHQKRSEMGSSLRSGNDDIDESNVIECIGLVEHQDPSDIMPDQKLSSFLRYLHEYSGMIDPWINNLNYESTRKTADKLMLFIAQQSLLTLKELDAGQAVYYKRNLYSELQFFHEYIKKRTSELSAGISSSPGQSGDLDYLKRYLLHHWKKDQKGQAPVEKVAEENFLLMISFWFSNICQIQ